MTAASTRWHALDALRALAIVLMVQGHTFYEVLDPRIKALPWYRLHEVIHGHTAPMFLFAAGLAFGVTTLPRIDAHAVWGPVVRKRMQRYAMLIVVGYALQLPGQSLLAPLAKGMLWSPRVFAIGPLQLIGVLLGACQIFVLVAKSRTHLMIATTVALLALLGGSAFVWQAQLSSDVALPLAMWLDSTRGSHFPIFPWAAFLLAGILAAHLVVPRVQARGHASAQAGAGRLAWTVGFAVVGAVMVPLVRYLWRNRLGLDAWWPSETSPFFVLQRLGYVLLALSVLCAIEQIARRLHARPGFFSVAEKLSAQALGIYVAHMLVLYGTPLTRGIAPALRGKLSLVDAALASVLVLALSVVLVAVWAFLAKRRWQISRYQVSLAAIALACLLARDALRLIQIGLLKP